ncbi:MAG: septal ring lytic transglycosylase RlpA family protein [Treponema sp.]|nr:septal ring lytic transglycosylase RlpA family protein [Treponema sp.]
MKKICFILVILFTAVIFPVLAQNTEVFRQDGIASWYGREFDGRPTASGEIFDSSKLTAAHPTLPFGTELEVTNIHNNKKVTVRINDRGPFVAARIIDVSRAAAELLDMVVTGTAPVKIESTGRVVLSSTAVGGVPHGAQMSSQSNVQDAPVFVSQPVVVQEQNPGSALSQFRLIPSINVLPEKNYRLQVGSFRVARYAVDAFDRIKKAGLNPAYERYSDNDNGEFFRVVIAGVRGGDMQIITEKLSAAGFREAIIRAEN